MLNFYFIIPNDAAGMFCNILLMEEIPKINYQPQLAFPLDLFPSTVFFLQKENHPTIKTKEVDVDLYTPLHRACDNNDVVCTELLLKAKADPDVSPGVLFFLENLWIGIWVFPKNGGTPKTPQNDHF